MHTCTGYTGTLELRNARVENCGRIFLGEYCMHLHMLGDCSGCMLASNAIVDGVNKGIVIHGTHHAALERNVVYDVKGASIYVENGQEMENLIVENVVGCSTLLGCLCLSCVPSHARSDGGEAGETEQTVSWH